MVVVRIFTLLLLVHPALTWAENSIASPHQNIINFHYMNPISKTDFRNPGQTTLAKTMAQATASTCIFVDNVGFQGTNTTTATQGSNCAFFVSADNGRY